MRNRIVFFGTPYFAAALLEYLHEIKIPLVGIVTQPDRPRGRFQNLSFSSVKETALRCYPDVQIFQPEKTSNPEFIQKIALLKPDLFVVVGYGQILRQQLLDIPGLGSINVHASLLPKYRGAAPMQRCLMAGEAKTGITIMKLTAELDAGNMLAKDDVAISENMNLAQLEAELLKISKPLLKNVLSLLEKGAIAGEPQDHSRATYAKKLAPEEFQISWNFSAQVNHNLIRALSPKPAAWTWITLEGERKRLKILKTEALALPGKAPGEILRQDSCPFIVACQEGSLAIREVQLEGKRVMSIDEFLRGVKGKILI